MAPVPAGTNHVPVIEALRDTSLMLGDTLRARVVAADPDGDRLTYRMTPLLRDLSESDYVPDAVLDPNTGHFWFAPGVRDQPQRSILFTAVDDRGYPASTQITVSASYHLDQVNEHRNGAQNIVVYRPMGQEFTPTLAALDIVELRLDPQGTPAEFIVNIREGTITGPVVGVSDTLRITTARTGAVAFEFARVPLTPHLLYVMEIAQLSGPSWLVDSAGGPASTYPGGRQITQGQPKENSDLWFREGVRSPLPETVTPVPALNRRRR